MNKQQGYGVIIVLIIIAVIAVGAVGFYLWPSSPNQAPTQQEGQNNNTPQAENQDAGNSMPVGEYSGAVLAGNSAVLLDFNKQDYEKALQTDKLVALYFYANWCPICKAEFPEMQQVFNELSTDKVIGFRVNFNDTDTDEDEVGLAREFGVAYQHTKVFVKNNERILKSPESWGKARYFEEINKVIAQ